MQEIQERGPISYKVVKAKSTESTDVPTTADQVSRQKDCERQTIAMTLGMQRNAKKLAAHRFPERSPTSVLTVP